MTKLAPPVDDFLAMTSPRGEAYTLDMLLALCRDEPLADVDENDRQWMTPGEHARWWKEAAELHRQFPGFQSAYWKLEHMKYGHCRGRGPLPERPLPDIGGPLSEFVRARGSHAKALWSMDIAAGRTRLQFRDWLRLHINGETWMPPVWPDMPGWSEALQVLRIACGLPGVDPTITWELRPPPRRISPRRPPR